MKLVKIIQKDQIREFRAEDPTEHLNMCVDQNIWGKPERWVPHKDEGGSYDEADVLDERMVEVSPAVAEVVNDANEVVQEATPAVMKKEVKLKAEYSVEIEDISAQVEQERINAEALKYLADTDWMIIRELDAGIPCPSTIKTERAAARARIIK